MAIFSNRKAEPTAPEVDNSAPPVAHEQPTRTFTPAPSGILSQGVSITGSVKFTKELLVDGEVEGTIDSGGVLTLGEHSHVRGEIRTKSVTVKGSVEGNIVATERCELQAGCTLLGDIDAPRLVVDEAASFRGSANIATPR
jgi:cytoskeletal protein CcmA (bactofilin family)